VAWPYRVAAPADVLWLYRYLSSDEYRPRRFVELADPALRASFAFYDYAYDVAFLTGYLYELGKELGREVIDLELETLHQTWRGIAERAGHGFDPAVGVEADLGTFGRRVPAGDPLVDEARAALNRYAPVVLDVIPEHLLTPFAAANVPTAPEAAVAVPAPHRLLAIWHELRASGEPVTADRFDLRFRDAAVSFRDAAAVVERAAQRETARTAATAA
jgi:hypothetical protein